MIFFWLFCMLVSASGQVKDVPFSKGFNLHDWFENFNEITNIKFKQFVRQDFEDMKALGCDHVRVPIEFFDATGPAPDFEIDPMLYMFIDEVADWAEELEMYLILDNHSFDNDKKTNPEIIDTLLAVWSQVAEHFKDRSDYILYEVLNEPHDIPDNVWNSMQQQAIDAIRTVDAKHTIIVGPANWYNYNNLYQMPEYSDTNLIYSFHFYDPYLFTTAVDIVIPYPYDPGRMPAMPVEWAGEWYEELYNDYPSVASDEFVYRLIDTAINFRETRNVPVYCGEFGVNLINCEEEDRAYWISLVRNYLEVNNIPWTMWTYTDYMGIFDPATPELYEYHMDTLIAKALGLNYPDQKEFHIFPDSTGFFIYDDYVPGSIIEESWANGGEAQYLLQDNPRVGNFCLSWKDADQYGNLGFRFFPVRDLSRLNSDGYVLDFWVKCNTPGTQIEIRFEDTDTGTTDHAWRKSVMLDNSVATFDGTWQHVEIPLSDFWEYGAWEDDSLYPPENKFDWTRINRFDFVAEYSHLHDIEFFFDHIQIVDSSVHTPYETPVIAEYKAPDLSVYFDNHDKSIHINFSLPQTLPVNISVFDIQGRKQETVTGQIYSQGDHTIIRSIGKLSAGFYYIHLQAGDFTITRELFITHQ